MIMATSSDLFFTYDVFLSFRGETRYGFTGHLYNALCKSGINAFMDDQLRMGDDMGPTLLESIETSRISILVISEHFASSSWCLDEVVKIMECYDDNKGQHVLPIFYKVEPSHALQYYEADIIVHEERFRKSDYKMKEAETWRKMVQAWRLALSRICHLSIRECCGDNDYEPELIKKIVKDILAKLPPLPSETRHVVGLDSRFEQVKSFIDIEPDNDVRILEIYGHGGIGKTTFAKYLYNKIKHQFEATCFLDKVREKSNKSIEGLEHLQKIMLIEMGGKKEIMMGSMFKGGFEIKRRLGHRRVLLVLDDVDSVKQLETLFGGGDWFGSGSIVLITTRDKAVLDKHVMDDVIIKNYEMEKLNYGDSLQLFCWHAFNMSRPANAFECISSRAIEYAKGFPLALKLIGSNLKGRTVEECNDELDEYKKVANDKIHGLLERSYTSLFKLTQKSFLDIACFFKGEKWKCVEKVLKTCDFRPSVRELICKCLITIDENDCMEMHDEIQDMGREIVRRESPLNLGKCSRSWSHEEILEVLKENSSMSNEDQTEAEASSAPSSKRARSTAWTYFERFTDKDGNPMVKCTKCGEEYMVKEGNGTSNMVLHLRKCLLEVGQSSFPPLDQDMFRDRLASAIIKHGLPFSFVEQEGIRELHHFLNPRVRSISRNTATSDVLKIYQKEKENLKCFLRSIPSKICLTSDLWSSITTDHYMVVTAHFVTREWELQKKVIAFFRLPPPHSSANVAEELLSLLKEWGIEKRIFTITLDNAFYNVSMVNLLKKNHSFGNALVGDGKYFHVKCGAHVLNLIVQEGLKVIDDALYKIRECVKYVRGSDTKKATFASCIDQTFPTTKSRKVHQDVPTRWNSTYLMLKSALEFQEAFSNLSLIDKNFEHCPSEEEWDSLRKISKFLEPFYDICVLFSGTSYPTTNLFFYNVWKVQMSLKEAAMYNEGGNLIYPMATQMREIFDKYWDCYSEVLSFASILDPRCKLHLVEFCFTKLYGLVGYSKTSDIYGKLNALLIEYGQIHSSQAETRYLSSQKPMRGSLSIPSPSDLDEFGQFQLDNHGLQGHESDLKNYMDEKMYDFSEELDILGYWKSVESKYPVLSLMARDILSIPITTFASDSAFSIGGRILDKYRTCLLPENVEALLCTNDWLFGTPPAMNFDGEELVEDFSAITR